VDFMQPRIYGLHSFFKFFVENRFLAQVNRG
jgi:hypothetical protein